MLMETFNRLTRKDKYVWDVSIFLKARTSPFTHNALQMYGHVSASSCCIRFSSY